jgi:hypothetical protein
MLASTFELHALKLLSKTVSYNCGMQVLLIILLSLGALFVLVFFYKAVKSPPPKVSSVWRRMTVSSFFGVPAFGLLIVIALACLIKSLVTGRISTK